jgi:hypothetical protein
MKKPSAAAQEAAATIGYYFLNFFKGDYQKTNEYINKLGITNIEVDENSIKIYSGRPGLLIGRHGVHAEGIGKVFPNKKFLIEESFCWSDYMYPYDPADYFE